MSGAIFYATKYGSTREYARWISEATCLAVHDINERHVEIEKLDFLVIGMPIIYYKLFGRQWVLQHQQAILQKPVILFTVSGTSAGPKLNGWIANSLPQTLINHLHHVALRGRQNPKELTFFDRMMLIIGGMKNPDKHAAQEELHGFDYMNKANIQPVVELIERLKFSESRSEALQTANAHAGNQGRGIAI